MTGARFKSRLPACQLECPDDIVKSQKSRENGFRLAMLSRGERYVMLPEQHTRPARGSVKLWRDRIVLRHQAQLVHRSALVVV